jgi:RNA polymerase sigma factor (sigma-70 family)
VVNEHDVAELVKRAADGDAQAWNAIVDRFSGLVWSVSRSYGLSRADASDVFQTVWLRLVEHLTRLREPERLAGWLATTARNECLKMLRKAGRTIATDDDATFDRATPGDLGDGRGDLDRALLAEERDSVVWKAFATIPARCQTLLRLLTADPPIAYTDVSAMLDMPIGSIGPTRARCLDKLRTALAHLGITADTAGS